MRRLMWPTVVFGCWIAGLATLAMLTANPVTLNRSQILAADLILEIKADDSERPADQRERWKVARSWPEVPLEQPVEIEGLDASTLEEGQSYLVPVNAIAVGQYRIVLAPSPLSAPLVYPATPQTIVELQRILQERATP